MEPLAESTIPAHALSPKQLPFPKPVTTELPPQALLPMQLLVPMLTIAGVSRPPHALIPKQLPRPTLTEESATLLGGNEVSPENQQLAYPMQLPGQIVTLKPAGQRHAGVDDPVSSWQQLPLHSATVLAAVVQVMHPSSSVLHIAACAAVVGAVVGEGVKAVSATEGFDVGCVVGPVVGVTVGVPVGLSLGS